MKPILGASTLLDRLTHRRSDPDFIESLVRSPNGRFLVLIDGKPVIVTNEARDAARIRWLTGTEIKVLGLQSCDTLFLGVDRADGTGHFAMPLTEHRAKAVPGGLAFLRPAVDLRSLATQGSMVPDELSLLGKAKALASWHEDARCCGHCGGVTRIKDGGWRRKCWACGKEWFPRIDPVVIMLITDGERCVLGHESRYPDKMFSTLAGYVEPGEDLEHAVRRETAEEVGLQVDEVKFHSTQPWPFPHSLMIGCIGHCTSAPLNLEAGEIEEARWFSRHEVRDMLAGKHPEGLWVPGKQAIAHVLIQAFADG